MGNPIPEVRESCRIESVPAMSSGLTREELAATYRPALSLLPEFFREKATQLREDAAAEQPARAYERCAELLEAALRHSLLEALPLREAEIESGYSKSHLRRLIRDGVVPNAGTENRPRILRRNLPRKPGHGVRQDGSRDVFCRSQVARVIAQGGT